MALIYRAHFAFIRSPIVNSKGVNFPTDSKQNDANVIFALWQAIVRKLWIERGRILYGFYKAARDGSEDAGGPADHPGCGNETYELVVTTKRNRQTQQ